VTAVSDLSRSLVDAAAEAIPTDPCWPDDREAVVDWELVSTTREARAEDVNLPEAYGVPQWGPVEQVARAVVAAVLETLADSLRPFNASDGERTHPVLGAGALRRLAADVKEET
jgi:hypothetical protein